MRNIADFFAIHDATPETYFNYANTTATTWQAFQYTLRSLDTAHDEMPEYFVYCANCLALTQREKKCAQSTNYRSISS